MGPFKEAIILLGAPNTGFRYHQAHQPIAKQTTIEGHAVRAMYLLTAVADLVRLSPHDGFEETYWPALIRLWDNMIEKKMYLTGGIGAMK